MPPKKRRRSINPKAGVAKTYLEENFRSFPTTVEGVKNGHILYVYVTSGDSSYTECGRQLRTLLEKTLDLITTKNFYFKDIARIVSSILKKYRRLGDPGELSKFKLACDEPFALRLSEVSPDSFCDTGGDDSIQPGPSIEVGNAGPVLGASPTTLSSTPFTTDRSSAMRSTPDCGTSSSMTRSRSQSVTPVKQKPSLRKRLAFVSEQKAELGREVKGLKKQLKTPKMVINQALKRKNNIIARKNCKIWELQRRLRQEHLANELASTKAQLRALQHTHRTLKCYRRKKAKDSAAVSRTQYEHVLAKLVNQDETIKSLEQEKIELQEVIEEMKATTQATKLKI